MQGPQRPAPGPRPWRPRSGAVPPRRRAARPRNGRFGTGRSSGARPGASRDVDSRPTTAVARQLAAEVRDIPGVTDVSSYWSGASPALRASDGERALILARLEGSATDTREQLAALSPELARTTPELNVSRGHRGGLALRAAGVPVLLPELVRVRGGPRRPHRGGRSAAPAPRRARPLGPPGGATGACGERLLAAGRPRRDAPARSRRCGGGRRPAAGRVTAARPAVRAAGRADPATGTSSCTTSETIHEEFPAEPTDTVQVVLREAASAQDTRTYAAELSRIQGVFQVDAPTGSYQDGRRTGPSPITPGAPGRDGDGGAAGEHAGEDAGEEAGSRLAVVPTQAAMHGDVPAFVDAVRDTPAPVPALVGGYPAETTDFRATLLDRARSTEATAPAPGSARRRGEWKGPRGTPAGVRVIATLG